ASEVEAMGLWILLLGLVVFFAMHSVRMVAGGYRDAQIAAGERRWKGRYSLVSLAGIALVIAGWILFRGDAPEIYEPPAWGRHIAMGLVLLAFILLPAANMPAGRIRATTSSTRCSSASSFGRPGTSWSTAIRPRYCC